MTADMTESCTTFSTSSNNVFSKVYVIGHISAFIASALYNLLK